ncbi:MAG TPA: NAD(P)-dependent oxidoreductase [Acidimicrobiales bacterium]|nr:NAD(P)-dependent oxidoreductase [Acidimicrobiales bacterium]
MRAGFIGLGSQGGPMARRIAALGHPLAIWARRPATLEPFAGTGATVVGSPAEVAAASDVVGICVVTDRDVEEVVLGDEGVLAGMAPGGVIAIHSTVHPDTCRRVAARAAERAVDVIDAPVSGGGPAAAEGRLVVMVGGEAPVLERVRPVLTTYGNPVVHLGPIGSGQVAKLLNNLLFTAHLGAALEAFDFAAALGVDRAAFATVLERGSGGSFGAQMVARSGFATAGMRQTAATLLTKDLDLMADVARRAGVAQPPQVAELARAALQRYAEGG